MSAPLSPPHPPSWRSRLDTLRVKLFLAIAGANVVLMMAAYLIYSWSFDQGLVEYLNRADEARLTPVISRLADGYQREGDWRWITEDRQRWQALLRDVLGVRVFGRRDAPSSPPDSAPPAPAPASSAAVRAIAATAAAASAPASAPPLPPFTIDPRLLLFDAERTLLIGPPDRAADAVLKPITVQGRVVGHLGYVPRLQMMESVERVFVAQQGRKFAAIALGLLAAVLLTAALIARWLSRRLGVLGAAAAAVADGDYAVRLPVRGHDELARLGDGFNHMAASLQAAQQARQQWIADIAHELRTPLATLRAEIEALQDGVRQPTPAHLGSLAQEVSRLTRLVEDLRLLSLSDMGALDYHFEPTDLGEFVADHLALARGQLSPGLQLHTDLPRGVRARIDSDRLAQVLANILQNTLRYSDPPATLRVQLDRHEGQARLVWEDSAPGVPAEALPRLTERLFRVDDSRARASGGSGLGLSIAQAIVEGHGGRMTASASPLGGLRWTLTLPLSKESPHG